MLGALPLVGEEEGPLYPQSPQLWAPLGGAAEVTANEVLKIPLREGAEDPQHGPEPSATAQWVSALSRKSAGHVLRITRIAAPPQTVSGAQQPVQQQLSKSDPCPKLRKASPSLALK